MARRPRIPPIATPPGTADWPWWKVADHLPDLPIRSGKIELHLKVEPELGIGAKPVAEPQCRITGDRALAGDDLAYTARRHGERADSVGVTPKPASSSFRMPPGYTTRLNMMRSPFINGSPRFQALGPGWPPTRSRYAAADGPGWEYCPALSPSGRTSSFRTPPGCTARWTMAGTCFHQWQSGTMLPEPASNEAPDMRPSEQHFRGDDDR